MEEESYIVMQNFDNEELGLSSADLNTIIQVPTLEPFMLSEESHLVFLKTSVQLMPVVSMVTFWKI